MKNRILLLLVCCAMVVSCSKDGNGDSRKPDKVYAAVTHLDIANAEYLFSTKSSGARTRSSSDDNVEFAQLFKVAIMRNSQEVGIVDTNGETIPVEKIMIAPMTDDIIFFGYTYKAFDYNDGYGYDYYSHYYPAHLVKISDGTVFELPEQFKGAFGWGIDGFSDIVNNYGVYRDKDQNLYCIGDGTPEGASLYKITPSATGVNATKLADDLDFYDANLYVDLLGNAIYSKVAKAM